MTNREPCICGLLDHVAKCPRHGEARSTTRYACPHPPAYLKRVNYATATALECLLCGAEVEVFTEIAPQEPRA